MNKNVIISIKGMQFDLNDDSDQIETLQQGQYYERGNIHYLIYEEPVEGTNLVTKNMIKFNENKVSLSRSGSINTTLLFDLAEKNHTNYQTPYGSLMIGLDTQHISLNKSDDEIHLKVQYALDINYEFLANCNIDIIAKNALEDMI